MFITNMLWKYFFHIVKIFLLCCLSTYFGGCIYPATWGPLVTTSPLCLQPVTGRRTRWKESSREMQNSFCEMQKYFLRNEKYFLRNAKILSEKCKNTFWEMQKYFLRNAKILSEKNVKIVSEECKNTFWEMQNDFQERKRRESLKKQSFYGLVCCAVTWNYNLFVVKFYRVPDIAKRIFSP